MAVDGGRRGVVVFVGQLYWRAIQFYDNEHGSRSIAKWSTSVLLFIKKNLLEIKMNHNFIKTENNFRKFIA